MDFSWRCTHWGSWNVQKCAENWRTSGTWTPCRELSAGLSVDELLGHWTPHTTSCLQMIHWGQQWTTSMWICIGNSPLVSTVIHMRLRFNFIVDILCELLINYLLTCLITFQATIASKMTHASLSVTSFPYYGASWSVQSDSWQWVAYTIVS